MSEAGTTATAGRPDAFSFSRVATTRFLTIEIVSHATGGLSGVGEVVFSQNVSAVPEPGSYAVMGLGLLAIGMARRRRMAPH